MKSFFFFLLVCAVPLYAEEESREELLQHLPSYGQYQDILIDNAVVIPGWGPSPSSHYQALQQLLACYTRPITVLEIGAKQGYFSLRIAHDYEATCVMIEAAPLLLDICKLNASLDNLILLQKKISVEELCRLSECEHFDLVLALNAAHHMGQEWREFLDAVFTLGDQILIETPYADDLVAETNPTIPEIAEYLLQQEGGQILSTTERYRPEDYSTLFWFPRKKESLKRTAWDAPLLEQGIAVESDFEEKRIGCRPGIRGIHLKTFDALNGVYPTFEQLAQKRKAETVCLLQGEHVTYVPEKG